MFLNRLDTFKAIATFLHYFDFFKILQIRLDDFAGKRFVIDEDYFGHG